MKLATYEKGGEVRIGIVSGEGIIDLSRVSGDLPLDMISLIGAWQTWGATVRGAASQPAHERLSDIRLLAPVLRPQKILAIGLNYADHIAESGQKAPDKQVWFSKLPNALNGPFDPIHLPKTSAAVDYEAELVVVIGKRCRHVSRELAKDAIFGFCCGNDVSVRDWQFQTPQWILGKSFDTHAPIGPWITTPDETGDPHSLRIRCMVNGETRQDSNTRHLVFDIYDQISHVTQAMTLEPGDLIFTGTPGGVGMAAKPPNYLKAGDRVRVEIDRLGAIEAHMITEPDARDIL